MILIDTFRATRSVLSRVAMKPFGVSCPRACRMLTAQVAGVGRTSCAHHLSENLFVRHIRNKHASQQRVGLQYAREHTSFSRTRYHVRHVSAAAAEAPVVTHEADEGKRGLSSMPEQEVHHTIFQVAVVSTLAYVQNQRQFCWKCRA